MTDVTDWIPLSNAAGEPVPSCALARVTGVADGIFTVAKPATFGAWSVGTKLKSSSEIRTPGPIVLVGGNPSKIAICYSPFVVTMFFTYFVVMSPVPSTRETTSVINSSASR